MPRNRTRTPKDVGILIQVNPVLHVLRRIWRWLPMPHGLRGIVVPLLHRFLEQQRRRTPPPLPIDEIRPGGLYVAGMLNAALGLGEAARLHLQAFTAAGIEAQPIDLSDVFVRRDFDHSDDATLMRGGGVIVLEFNAPETINALAEIGASMYRKRMLIGVWHWELPVLPPEWRAAAGYLHEIWTSSQFCAEAIRRSVDVPVRVVPIPPAPIAAGPGRAAFDIGPDVFVCLNAFDMRSSLARKNPLAAVRAFKAAFGSSSRALLILKSHSIDPQHPSYQELRREIDGVGNIRLIEEVWSRQHMHHCLQCCDAVISLHRAEGYGLLMAEALSYGIPSVATGWSGNLDFLNDGNAMLVRHDLVPVDDPQGIYPALPGAVWAEPDIQDAARKLRMLSEDPALARRLGDAGAAAMMEAGRRDAFLAACGPVFMSRIANMVQPVSVG